MILTCPNCGNKCHISELVHFCPKCGYVFVETFNLKQYKDTDIGNRRSLENVDMD